MSAPQCHLTDAQILRAIDATGAQTGWKSADLLIDMVAMREGIDRDLVEAVHVSRAKAA
jgi:hypothetical protein